MAKDSIPPGRDHSLARPKVYGVPRRFGIGTLLGVATAGALLVWAMQMLAMPPVAIIFTGIFLALIGVMQAVMQQTPRWASILVGEVCVVGMSAVMHIMHGQWPNSCGIVWLLIGGLIYGYLGGVLVAGLFLVMDGLASLLARRQRGDDS